MQAHTNAGTKANCKLSLCCYRGSRASSEWLVSARRCCRACILQARRRGGHQASKADTGQLLQAAGCCVPLAGGACHLLQEGRCTVTGSVLGRPHCQGHLLSRHRRPRSSLHRCCRPLGRRLHHNFRQPGCPVARRLRRLHSCSPGHRTIHNPPHTHNLRHFQGPLSLMHRGCWSMAQQQLLYLEGGRQNSHHLNNPMPAARLVHHPAHGAVSDGDQAAGYKWHGLPGHTNALLGCATAESRKSDGTVLTNA
jgi:hypothetical protein